MALLSDLVTTISIATGLPEATVFAYGRFAREGGLIAQKGRGNAAARMSKTDAANLLLAIGGTGVTREAADAIALFRPMIGYGYLYSNRSRRSFWNWLSPIAKVQRDGFQIEASFGEFVEFLLDKASQGELGAMLRRISTGKQPEDVVIGEDVYLSVKLFRTAPRAEITISRLWRVFDTVVEFNFLPTWDRGQLQIQSQGDLQASVEFTQTTLGLVGLCLLDKPMPRAFENLDDMAAFLKSNEMPLAEMARLLREQAVRDFNASLSPNGERI